jgi:hypothetical protein
MKIDVVWVNRVDRVVMFSNGLILCRREGESRFFINGDAHSAANMPDSREMATMCKLAKVELGS